MSRPLILVVDDLPTNLHLLRGILQNDYRLVFAKDGARALELAHADLPDLILLDVMMPGMSGLETCRALKADMATARTPVIFVTALTDAADEVEGFEAGGVDYITKPFSPSVVLARVKTHLALTQLDEIARSRLEIAQRLGRAAEYKDNETGLHILRMSHYARELARAAGMEEEAADLLLNAAPLHDVGKIGIPDHILRKDGPLTAEEWEVMKTHPRIGADIIGEHAGGVLAMAHRVALTHHEKWDGSGYPEKLKGEAICIEGRIVAIADVYDALTSPRPYKPSWPDEKAIAFMQEQRGRHFDPRLLDIFLANVGDYRRLVEAWRED